VTVTEVVTTFPLIICGWKGFSVPVSLGVLIPGLIFVPLGGLLLRASNDNQEIASVLQRVYGGLLIAFVVLKLGLNWQARQKTEHEVEPVEVSSGTRKAPQLATVFFAPSVNGTSLSDSLDGTALRNLSVLAFPENGHHTKGSQVRPFPASSNLSTDTFGDAIAPTASPPPPPDIAAGTDDGVLCCPDLCCWPVPRHSAKLFVGASISGSFSAFFSIVFGSGAAPAMLLFSLIKLEKDVLRATAFFVYYLSLLQRFIMLIILNLIDWENGWPYMAGVTVVSFIGVIFGQKVSKFFSVEMLQKIILLLLFIAGVVLAVLPRPERDD